MSIGDNIKMIRHRYGLTQQQLGEIAGVSDKAVSTWESGLKEPRMGAIQKISDHFGIPKSAIIDDDSPLILPDRTATVVLTDDEKSLLADYRSLSASGKEYIRQTMAMAVQSFSGKNQAASDLEAAQ